MCGIAGFTGEQAPKFGQERILAMMDSMRHRGPDAQGSLVKEGIALGQRRLAIIDLSEAARQPIFDQSGRYCIIYNGEVYNFKEVKAKLQGYHFNSNSDTDVILAAYIEWGPACVELLNGMFAFAIWDDEKQELFLARDRMGIKPLYYYKQGQCLVFASELRALLASDLVPRTLNRSALQEYLQYYSVNSPNTLLADVFMLKAGHWALWRSGDWQCEPYWSLSDIGHAPPEQSYEEICRHTRELLSQSVEKRLLSDVPLGAFLSGGIDSSAIVALMAEVSDQPVNTFSVTFSEKAYDESPWSEMMAQKYGTVHHPIPLDPSDFLKDLPEALSAMDHPSGDGLNSYVVSKVTREAGITVALSGLGGDELFGGYPVFKRYQKLRQMNLFYSVPTGIRSAIGKSVSGVYNNHKTARLQELLSINNNQFSDLYPVFRKIFDPVEIQGLLAQSVPSSPVFQGIFTPKELSQINLFPFMSQVSVGEMSTYTQNVLLRDTDQMGMASSLEVRVPFFDHELVEYVLSLPDHHKPMSSPKKLLVDAMGELLPEELVYRKKMGFMFPWTEWIRTSLKDFCEDHIQTLSERTFIHAPSLLETWQGFLNHNKQTTWIKIWMLVVLENWMRQNQIDA
ncbi:MAG: asparagine synthase (glutamine-hydrolyzing) [Bacteroidota bacterium]